MQSTKIRTYQPGDHDDVIALWRKCKLVVPQNDPSKDISRKLANSPELFFIGEIEGKVIATVMAGYDGHRGAVNYLAVSPEMQGSGLGRELMMHVEKTLQAIGCIKINLDVRSTNLRVADFYKSMGYQVDDVISLGKRLVSD